MKGASILELEYLIFTAAKILLFALKYRISIKPEQANRR